MNNSDNKPSGRSAAFSALRGNGGHVPAALKNIGKNPMANAAMMGATRNAASGGNTTIDENGEEVQENPTLGDNIKAGAKAAAQVGKEQAKKAIKKKIFAVIAPYILPALLILAAVIVVVMIAAYAYDNINQLTDLAISGGETALNFVTGNGLNDNMNAAIKKIDEAGNENSGLDKGILIATLNDSIFISPTLYDEEYEEPPEDDDDIFDAGKNFIASKYSIHSFYNVKRDMIGEGTGDPGSALNSIIGMEIGVECVPKSKVSEMKNARVLFEYAYQGLLAAQDTYVTEISDRLDNGFRTIWFGSIELNYKNQGSDFVWKETKEAENFIDNLPQNAIKKDWADLKQKASECSTQYEKDANGNPITTKPLAAQYTSVEKINDYEKYYNYIRKVYVPVLYMSTWGQLNSEAKTKLVHDVWDDIVSARNDYYAGKGVDNVLVYNFDLDGSLITNIYGGGMLVGGIGNLDISNFSTSGPGAIALSWKQYSSAWGRNEYISGYTMSGWGCLISSIAKLMRLSGTQINSASFDPWTLAQVSKYYRSADRTCYHKGDKTDISGNLCYNTWQSLVPNFKYVRTIGSVINTYNGNVSGQLEKAIEDSGYVGDQYYYIIYIEYYRDRDHGHYIAVVGKDENGLILSDPAYGGDTYHVNDIASVVNGSNVTIKQFQVYEKLD